MVLEKISKYLFERFFLIKEKFNRSYGVLIPLILFFSFPAFGAAIPSISLIIFIVVAIGLYKPKKINEINYIALFGLCGFYLFSCFSLLWSENVVNILGTMQSGLSLPIVTLIFLVYPISFSRKHLALLKGFFILAMVVYFYLWLDYHIQGYSLFQINKWGETPLNSYSFFDSVQKLLEKKYVFFGYIAEWGYYSFSKFPDFFLHNTYNSFAVILALIFLVDIFFEQISYFLRILCIFIFCLLTFFIFQMTSKVNIALIGLVFSLIIVKLKINFKFKILSGVLFLTLITLIFHEKILEKAKNIDWLQTEQIKSDNNTFIDFQRLQLYKTSWEIFNQYPVCGIGIGDLDVELNKRVIRNSKYEGITKLEDIRYNTHSQYLNYLAGTGLIGFLLFLIFIGINFSLAIKHQNLYHVIFFTGFAINLLFENFLDRSWGVYLYLIGWIVYNSETKYDRVL